MYHIAETFVGAKFCKNPIFWQVKIFTIMIFALCSINSYCDMPPCLLAISLASLMAAGLIKRNKVP